MVELAPLKKCLIVTYELYSDLLWTPQWRDRTGYPHRMSYTWHRGRWEMRKGEMRVGTRRERAVCVKGGVRPSNISGWTKVSQFGHGSGLILTWQQTLHNNRHAHRHKDREEGVGVPLRHGTHGALGSNNNPIHVTHFMVSSLSDSVASLCPGHLRKGGQSPWGGSCVASPWGRGGEESEIYEE